MSSFIQTAVPAVTQPGIPLGGWLALITCGLLLAGVVYRAGVASTKADHVEGMVGRELKALGEKIDKVTEYIETSDKSTREVRESYTIWRERIDGRVARLEGEGPVFIHKRAGDQ